MNNFLTCFIINSGTAALPAETLTTATAALQAVAPYEIYFGILERVSAVAFHIFATVLVFKGVKSKNMLYYIAAIFAHMLFNLVAVLLAKYTGIIVCEIALLMLAGLAMVYVVKSKDCFE